MANPNGGQICGGWRNAGRVYWWLVRQYALSRAKSNLIPRFSRNVPALLQKSDKHMIAGAFRAAEVDDFPFLSLLSLGRSSTKSLADLKGKARSMQGQRPLCADGGFITDAHHPLKASNVSGELLMEQSMTEMPDFLLNFRKGDGSEPYILSCSIVGQTTGVRGIVRRFRNADELISALESVRITKDRYKDAVDLEPDETKSFPITLNEGQNLSLIQTDTTE